MPAFVANDVDHAKNAEDGVHGRVADAGGVKPKRSPELCESQPGRRLPNVVFQSLFHDFRCVAKAAPKALCGQPRTL